MGNSVRLLAWFIDCLKDRHQQVVIRVYQSEIGQIESGVPQGSVLGPFPFLIYIRDITMLTRHSMKVFAHDTTWYIEIDNQNNTSEKLNNDSENIHQLADQWLKIFCPSKTMLMTCSFRKKNDQPINFNNVMLKSVDSHKHLGLTISSNLTLIYHLDCVLNSVSAMCYDMKKLKYDVDRQSFN